MTRVAACLSLELILLTGSYNPAFCHYFFSFSFFFSPTVVAYQCGERNYSSAAKPARDALSLSRSLILEVNRSGGDDWRAHHQIVSTADLTFAAVRRRFGEAEGHFAVALRAMFVRRAVRLLPFVVGFIFYIIIISCWTCSMDVAALNRSSPPWESEPVTLRSPAHFPNRYSLVQQALNGALRQVYTLRLGTLRREGVPGPINHSGPRGGDRGKWFWRKPLEWTEC